MVGGIRDIITCAEFQIEIFMGYNFTGGRIFDFCIDFSMGLQCSANALSVIICGEKITRLVEMALKIEVDVSYVVVQY